jgi:PAS domain S-box-containing protein
LNDKWREFTGDEPSAGFGDGYAAHVHPDDIQKVFKAVHSESTSTGRFTCEYRLRRRDGSYRWIFDVAAPRFFTDGSFAGFIGSAIDITNQKVTQEALAKVSGQLIEAQEKERTRIARELHDDICQRLVLLSIQLDRSMIASDSSPAKAERRRPELERLGQLKVASQNCSEIAHSVQALSHELHSSNLDFLGLLPAVRGFCREFSEQHRVAVEFTYKDVPNPLPREVSLCVFRVVQEALHNAAKHSGVSCMEASLRGAPDAIELEVRDAGVGFDPEEAKSRGGLGLVSMQERVNLVQGEISIESTPSGGTKIKARIPLERENAAATA